MFPHAPFQRYRNLRTRQKGACRKTGFSRHVVLRTRISVEQARILSHSATTRGKGRRAIPPWQTRRGNTCGVSVSASLKTKYAFIEQYLFHGNVGNDAGICRIASELWRELQLIWCTCKFSACELSKEKPSFVFSFKEEDEDEDYLIHTLFLKNVSSISQQTYAPPLVYDMLNLMISSIGSLTFLLTQSRIN